MSIFNHENPNLNQKMHQGIKMTWTEFTLSMQKLRYKLILTFATKPTNIKQQLTYVDLVYTSYAEILQTNNTSINIKAYPNTLLSNRLYYNCRNFILIFKPMAKNRFSNIYESQFNQLLQQLTTYEQYHRLIQTDAFWDSRINTS